MEYDLSIIKSKINELNITQKEVAYMLGITEQTLSKWINGKLGNINTFIELLIFLDINIEDIKKESN